jgi:predicted helicase
MAKTPPHRKTWLPNETQVEFESLIPMGTKGDKAAKAGEAASFFKQYSNGVKSNADSYIYNFDFDRQTKLAGALVKDFNEKLAWWIASGRPDEIDTLLQVNPKVHKWIRKTKRFLKQAKPMEFAPIEVRQSLYRPFCREHYFFHRAFNEDIYQFPKIFPSAESEKENRIILVPGIGGRTAFWSLCANNIANLSVVSIDIAQCFPFYTYKEDGTNRGENITDWALDQFRSHYKDKSITKWDIFHCTYAVLHHPEYRTRYAANLKRELPRIPYAPDFHVFAKAGKRLAELHVDYEKQKEYPLERREKPGEKLNLRVEKMRLSKDKQTLIYNDFLTLTGIPKEAYDYRLGNRSALEWVIDQYQISTDKRSGITNDPNRDDDKEYILRLIGQVITVSLETVNLINALPELGLVKNDKEMAASAPVE